MRMAQDAVCLTHNERATRRTRLCVKERKKSRGQTYDAENWPAVCCNTKVVGGLFIWRTGYDGEDAHARAAARQRLSSNRV